MDKIRIAVIGVGNMGIKHVGNLLAYFKDDVEISGIMNSTPERSKECADAIKIPYFNNLDEITAENTDGVIIAAKTNKHTYYSKQILKKGIPCLIEKPLTANLSEAKDILDIAAENNTFILAGHVEHYNPAYREMRKQIALPFRSIKAYRVGDSKGRNRDISVILDLMIHDIGIIFDMMPKGKPELSANTMKKNHWQDEAKVRITYHAGCYADVVASRIASTRNRHILIKDYNYDFWEIDFLNNTLIKNKQLVFKGNGTTALYNELKNFINCIRGTETPLVDGKQGYNALKTALDLERCCREVEIEQRRNHRALVCNL